MFDEAQTIEEKLLQEICLFLNMQGEDNNYFSLILMGQPQLKENLNILPQFGQRLSISFCLTHLDENETGEYIKHRLSVSGTEADIFNKDAVREIYELSGGMPRVINNLCDMALLNGFLQKKEIVDRDVMEKVKAEAHV